MPEWKSAESYQKLLAAMYAAQDMKLDYRKIATYYGDGATYDSIEGRFRIIKKDAKKLKDEIDSGARPEALARGSTTASSVASSSFASSSATADKNTTPKKPRGKKAAAGSPTPKKDRVVGGRISKNNTPSKAPKVAAGYGTGMGENVVNGIKQETISSESSLYGGEEDAVGDVFEGLDLSYEGFQEGI